MGLSIKNDEVERMVRGLAARRGLPMTEALRQLLAEEEARATAARSAERQERYDAVMAIAARVAAMPDVSDLTDDEILGYDENGIPVTVIVDSSALVAVMRRESGFERLVDAMLDADEVLVPASCYLEVAMVIAGRKGPDSRPQIDALLERLRARVVTFGGTEARTAADAFLRYGKGRHPAGLNFGDCMAYAVAQAEAALLLFTGEDFARTDVVAASAPVTAPSEPDALR